MSFPVPPPVLHVVTDDATLGRTDFARLASAVLEAGGSRVALHLRGPGSEGGVLYALARTLLPCAVVAGATVLVNDRVDVAAAAGAHGVQLGGRSLPVHVARALLGGGALIGASVHSTFEAREATAFEGPPGVRGPDFLLVGTLFETPSHPGRAGSGADLLRVVARAAPGIPLVGIGGVSPERLPALRDAGVRGVAVLRGVWEAASPVGAVERYLTLWQDLD